MLDDIVYKQTPDDLTFVAWPLFIFPTAGYEEKACVFLLHPDPALCVSGLPHSRCLLAAPRQTRQDRPR